MKTLSIQGRCIGRAFPPFIIAELSGNHNHSLERALKIVEAAAAAGVDAIKLQTYTADTMTLDLAGADFFINNPNSLWHGRSLYDIYQEAHTPWEWHEPIFDLAYKLGLIAFSTPFDASAVEFLETLQVPCYKIASFENTDLALIRKVAATGKPILLSTGMATAAELDESVQCARDAGAEDIILLKCTSTYPASPANTHCKTIPHMRELFNCETGLSDHTLGIGAALGAIALGATVVEKHCTLQRQDGGIDAAFSMEPEEMRVLVQEAGRAWQALGDIRYGSSHREEMASLAYRRSLYFTQHIPAGGEITPENIRAIRPGYGLAPKYLDSVLGRRVAQDVRPGTPASWQLLR